MGMVAEVGDYACEAARQLHTRRFIRGIRHCGLVSVGGGCRLRPNSYDVLQPGTKRKPCWLQSGTLEEKSGPTPDSLGCVFVESMSISVFKFMASKGFK